MKDASEEKGNKVPAMGDYSSKPTRPQQSQHEQEGPGPEGDNLQFLGISSITSLKEQLISLNIIHELCILKNN